jgi:predicted nucleic acid-binding protein
VIINAMTFRNKNMKKKLSMVDCIAYQTALKKGLKFLTGDEGFKNIPYVKFVKK